MSRKRFKFTELQQADLVVDAVYEGGRSGNAGDDPLHPLIGVSNQGGFRYLGSLSSPKLIVLTSSFNEPDWPDTLDHETGRLTYFGDNKHPGRALHDTPRNGNRLLRAAFNDLHSEPPRLDCIPPILVFGNAGYYRDMVFLGLAVPGSPDSSSLEDLVAVWKIAGDERFQNYRAILTILDVPVIPRNWLRDIKKGQIDSRATPAAWQNFRSSRTYRPLKADPTIEHRTRDQQIPQDPCSLKIVKTLLEHFEGSPVSFEGCAARIVQLMDRNFVSFDLTRPSRDGGRDAIGLYRIGRGKSAILVDFAMEAKRYALDNSVGVREVSRLISRLRHRQFGVLVTTSFLNTQAYREVKEDGHPVVVIAAADIVQILAASGMTTAEDVKRWLAADFGPG